MTDNKTTTWSRTQTRSQVNIDDLPPEQRAQIEALFDDMPDDQFANEQWSYSHTSDGKTFQVDIKNGSVTVNGQTYASLDDVPPEEREHIEALRNHQNQDGLLGILRTAGFDIDPMPDHIRESLGGSPPPIQAPTFSAPPTPFGDDSEMSSMPPSNNTLPPGAVPRSRAMWQWILLAAVLVLLGVLAVRGLAA